MKRTVSKSQLAKKTPPSTQPSSGSTSQSRSHNQSIRRPQSSRETGLIKAKQLHTIIETFYSSLCDLPLERLISSADPAEWVADQRKTLSELRSKLERVEGGKEGEYYRCKLRAVESILDNISENVETLGRLNQLRNYSSSQSSNSSQQRSSASSAELQSIRLGDFRGEEHPKLQQMLSYDQYVISGQHSPQLQANTLQSEEEEEDEPLPMSHSEVFYKRPRTNHDKENINSCNTRQPADKTLSKIKPSKVNQSRRTVNPHLYPDESTSSQQAATKRVETVDLSQCSSSCMSSQQTGQEDDLVRELREELNEKDKAIQELLIGEQAYQDSLELANSHREQKEKEIMFLKEAVEGSSREKEKLRDEIDRLTDLNQELRETVRVERERSKKEEKAKDKVEGKLKQETHNLRQLLLQIERLREENRQCRKSERVSKGKLQVYTQKYFRVYGELQEAKRAQSVLLEEMKGMRPISKPDRIDEIKEIVALHKHRFLTEQS